MNKDAAIERAAHLIADACEMNSLIARGIAEDIWEIFVSHSDGQTDSADQGTGKNALPR